MVSDEGPRHRQLRLASPTTSSSTWASSAPSSTSSATTARRVDELLAREPDRVVVSPGPCTPNEAGISLEVVRRFPEAGVPTLGVCLGHQSLAQAFGGDVIRHEPVHGKTTTIEHDGRTIFTGLPSPLTVGPLPLADRRRRDAPGLLRGHGRRGGGVVMGIRHRELPAEGVQFHPESVLTDAGKGCSRNFLGLAA